MKAKRRMDCVISTHNYMPLEAARSKKPRRGGANSDPVEAGALLGYVSVVPRSFGYPAQRRFDRVFSTGGRNVSGIHFPDPAPNGVIAWGDMKGTNDALLFVFHGFQTVDGRISEGAIMEVFVSRGNAAYGNTLCRMMEEGRLNAEIKELRDKARP